MSDPIRSISQNNFILADQKEVSHDNTLSGNGTPESHLGLNETVLYENTEEGSTNSFTLSEKLTNFERVRIFANVGPSSFVSEVFSTSLNVNDSTFRYGSTMYMSDADGSPLQIYGISYSSNDGLTYNSVRSSIRWFSQGSTTSFGGGNNVINTIHKIVGINRIANN